MTTELLDLICSDLQRQLDSQHMPNRSQTSIEISNERTLEILAALRAYREVMAAVGHIEVYKHRATAPTEAQETRSADSKSQERRMAVQKGCICHTETISEYGCPYHSGGIL